jgi:hypothetical protein
MTQKDKITRLTPGRAREVGKNMKHGADALAQSHFKRVKLSDGQFSSVGKGQTLAHEYSLSYYVLAETMTGFEDDLNGYGEAVTHSADGLTDTDADSAVMLNRIAGIVPTANDSTRHDDAWRTGGRHEHDGTQ